MTLIVTELPMEKEILKNKKEKKTRPTFRNLIKSKPKWIWQVAHYIGFSMLMLFFLILILIDWIQIFDFLLLRVFASHSWSFLVFFVRENCIRIFAVFDFAMMSLLGGTMFIFNDVYSLIERKKIIMQSTFFSYWSIEWNRKPAACRMNMQNSQHICRSTWCMPSMCD